MKIRFINIAIGKKIILVKNKIISYVNQVFDLQFFEERFGDYYF